MPDLGESVELCEVCQGVGLVYAGYPAGFPTCEACGGAGISVEWDDVETEISELLEEE